MGCGFILGHRDGVRQPASARHAILPCVVVVLLIAVSATELAWAGEWQGRRVIKDGIVHVMNPADPIEPPLVYDLEEVWRLESETPEGELVFGAVEDIERDAEGNFYLLDYLLKTVHVVSPDGVYLRSLGREGEGPGEFQTTEDCFIASDGRVGVIEYYNQRITYLTPDGLPAGHWSAQGFGDLRVRPYIANVVPGGLVISCRLLEPRGDKATLRYFIGRFDNQGNLLTKLFERSRELQRGRPMVFEEEESEQANYYAVDAEGNAYISPFFSEYSIHVFNPDGTKKMIITREYEHLPRTEEQIAEMHSILEGAHRGWPDLEVRAKEFERDVMDLSVQDGCLWVETSRGWLTTDESVALVLDVFNSDGEFIRQVVLQGRIDAWEDSMTVSGDLVLRVTSVMNSLVGSIAPAKRAGDEQAGEDGGQQAVICYRLAQID